MENCRNFFNAISIANNIQNASDWRKLTLCAISKMGGKVTKLGCCKLNFRKGLLAKYGGSLDSTLRMLYPQQNWQEIPTIRKGSSETVSII